MKRIILGLLCGLFIMSLIGCETAKGVGKDIENTGQNIQEGVSSIGK